jgi:Cu-Zn family superoxide dismutase
MDSLLRIGVIASAAGFAVLYGCGRNDQDDRAILRDEPREESPAALEPNGARPNAADEEVALAPRSAAPVPPVTVARAELSPTEGNEARGTVTFVDDGEALVLDVTMTGLTPGPHGIHVHEFGDCSAPDASSAGEHLNPRNAPHGGPMSSRDERHPGDLGNIIADDEGNVRIKLRDTVLGSEPDFAYVGHALLVHASADDLSSQPSGNSGDPVSCGVIEAAPAEADDGGGPERSPG